MMKRMGSICAIPFLALSFSFGTVSVETDSGLAEAAPPTPQIAQREMKRSKYSQASPIYERAHQLIYGNEDVNGTAGRIRIAVLINGDENIIVEDRIKNQIYSMLRQKFPREYFALMKGTDVNTKLLQYAEEIYYDNRETATTHDTKYDISSTNRGFDVTVGRSNTDSHYYTDGSERDDYSGTRDYNGNSNRDWTEYNSNNTVNNYGGSNIDSSGTGNYQGTNSKVFNGKTVGDSRTDSISGGVHFGSRSDSVHRVKITKPSKVDVDGVPVGMQPRGLSDMRREDFVRAGRDCGYDYVFVVSFSNGESQIYKHDYILFNTNTVHKNVWMRVRFVDVASGDYLYRNNIVAAGKTHNGNVNGRVMERAVHKAMEEAMNDLDFVN